MPNRASPNYRRPWRHIEVMNLNKRCVLGLGQVKGARDDSILPSKCGLTSVVCVRLQRRSPFLSQMAPVSEKVAKERLLVAGASQLCAQKGL